MKIDLSIIIVTYNVKSLLRNCLVSLKDSIDHSQLSAEVFVVDNGSDDTQLMIADEFKWVSYTSNPVNDGFSKSNNFALKKARGKYFLVLNPDTELEKDTIQKIYQYMEDNPDVAIATGKVVLPDGNLDGACHRGFPTPWNSLSRFLHLSKKYPTSRLFNGYNMGYLDINDTHEVDCVTGAFMFVRKLSILGDDKHKEVGYFDEDYWANGEDIDWCYRFKLSGWKIMYVPIAIITHYKGASSGTQISSQKVTTADRKTKEKWINAFYDAMPIFYNKHYRTKYPFFVKWIVLLGVEIKRRVALRKLLSSP